MRLHQPDEPQAVLKEGATILGDPRMMGHLGGPESVEKLDERQARFEKPGSRQYRIVADGEPCGSVAESAALQRLAARPGRERCAGVPSVESGRQRDGRTVAYPAGASRNRYEESPSSTTQGSG